MTNKTKVLIIASLDKSASEERASIFQKYLKRNGFEVDMFDTFTYFSHMVRPKYFQESPQRFINYLTGLIKHKVRNGSYPLLEEMRLRGDIVTRYIQKTKPIITICQNPQDMSCLLSIPFDCCKILDSPTIFSEEIRLEKKVNGAIYLEIRAIEDNVFKKSDIVAFHWYTFFNLAKKQKRKIKNPLVANWGCYRNNLKAQFSNQPKTLYLGKLNSSWVNPRLLESLQKKSVIPIDVYSYEHPDSRYYSLKTKGYLNNLDKVANYQFGLITASRDELRSSGFSAKNLLYLSYGLPVLCPEWRKDELLNSAMIYYNESNFDKIIKKYSQKKNWLVKHKSAIALSKELDWEKTLSPLIAYLKSKFK